jgi:erythromycin esterase-like protein
MEFPDQLQRGPGAEAIRSPGRRSHSAMHASVLDIDANIIAGAARRASSPADYDPLIQLAGKAQFVLIGEASHGTHDFYAVRATLMRRLIEDV